MSYHLITLLFLALAAGSYLVGVAGGVGLFIGLGVASEAVFWIRLFRGPLRRHPNR